MAVIGVAAPSARSAPVPEVAAYERHLHSLRTLSFDFEYSTFEMGGGIGKKEKLIECACGSAAVRGDDFRFHNRARYLILDEGRFQAHDLEKEEVNTLQHRLHLQTSYRADDGAFDLTDFTSRPNPQYIVASWERSRKLKFEKLDRILRVLYGHLRCDGEESIVSIFKSSKECVVSDDRIDGHLVKRISCNSAYGKYDLSLDPAAGFSPRHIEVRKTGSDLFFGKPLQKYPLSAVGNRHPHEPIREYRLDLHVAELFVSPEIDRAIMTEFEVRDTNLYASGESFSQRLVVKLTNVRFQTTNADLTPVMVIPNGTRVQIEEAPSIIAEWRDGDVVKIVDEDALKRFQGLDEPGKPKPRSGFRLWLTIVSGILIVLALVFAALRRRRSAGR